MLGDETPDLHSKIPTDVGGESCVLGEGVAEVVPGEEGGSALEAVVGERNQDQAGVDLESVISLPGDDSVLDHHVRAGLRAGGVRLAHVGGVGLEEEFEIRIDGPPHQKTGAAEEEILAVTVLCGATQGLVLGLDKEPELDRGIVRLDLQGALSHGRKRHSSYEDSPQQPVCGRMITERHLGLRGANCAG